MTNGIAVIGPQATADYWLRRQTGGDEVLLTPEEIRAINRRIEEKCSSLTDLAKFPDALSAGEVREMILEAQQAFRGVARPEEHYDKNGEPITWIDYQEAHENCNLAGLSSTIPTRYGLTLRRVDLRILPTRQNYFDMQDYRHYDDLQGTALDPAEPLAVLHESRDGAFVFVRARHYSGWADRDFLALAPRKVWEGYIRPGEFLTVTANKKRIPVEGAGELLFQMGSILPLSHGRTSEKGDWRVRLPVKKKGMLREIEVRVPRDSTVHKGWLPCTRNNFIRQAFRFLGDVYGWGGMEESVDCSAFVGDVYRSMGIDLPRDSDQQELAMPNTLYIAELSEGERREKIRQAPAGTLLFKPGHVLLYLGEDEEENPLVIHAASSYFTFEDGHREKHFVRRIIVSDLRYRNWKNEETIDDITSIGDVVRWERKAPEP